MKLLPNFSRVITEFIRLGYDVRLAPLENCPTKEAWHEAGRTHRLGEATHQMRDISYFPYFATEREIICYPTVTPGRGEVHEILKTRKRNTGRHAFILTSMLIYVDIPL